jgi:hypothetical protein
MAHTHSHHHDPASYYTEQLCTIAFSGAFGGIAVAIYVSGVVNLILRPGILHYSLLAGGIMLLALVLIRAVALWLSVGKPEGVCEHDHGMDCCGDEHEHKHVRTAREGLPLVTQPVHEHGHDHSHGHGHSHAHGDGHSHGGHDEHEHEHAVTTATEGLPLVTQPVHEHGHDHSDGHGHSHAHGDGHSHGGHDHDHGWAPVRYIVLLVPILLYFFVPIERLRAGQSDEYRGEIDPAWAGQINSTGSLPELEFKELVGAADSPDLRKFYDGKTTTISGELVPSASNAKLFSLVRFRIRCCAADRVPLPVPILVDDTLAKEVPEKDRASDLQSVQELRNRWVQVTCQIQFHKRPDSPNLWMAVLVVRPTKEKPLRELIEETRPDSNPYI